MKVTVLYFAALRDLVGREQEQAALPENVTTIQQFTAWLEQQHPSLTPYLYATRIARNEVFANASDSIADGDTLALIPPVAGG